MTYLIRKTENGEQWWMSGTAPAGRSPVVNWSKDRREALTTANKDHALKALDYARAFDRDRAPDADYVLVEAA